MLNRDFTFHSGILLLAFVFSSAGLAFAQQPFGIVVGTVTDPTGASLPAVTVTIANTETEVRQTVVTTAGGDYSLPYLSIGTYDIEARQNGFRTTTRSGVVVAGAHTVRIDIRMELGDIREVIEVSVPARTLQTDTAVVGTTIDAKAVSDLPLNGRTFAQLATLVPGVAPQVSSSIGTRRKRGSIGTPFAITANGFSAAQNGFIYDGVAAMDLDSYNFAFSPSVDAIAEFRVQTSSYASAYGGTPGAQVEVITKSGTNAFHGTAWEFNRNNALAARNYFSPSKDPLNRNQFGANLGGPIRRNKAFFFFNWESGRQDRGTAGRLLSVPPAPFRTGDFSSLLAQGIVIADPVTRQPFSNNRIPSERLDPNAAILMRMTPTPNRAANALGANNFLTSTVNTRTVEDQYVARVNTNLSSRTTVSGRYIYDGLTTPNEAPVFGNDENINTATAHNLALSGTHTFSRTLVSNVLVGWNRFVERQVFGTTNKPEFDIACGRMHLPMVACEPVNYGPPTIQAGYSMFSVRDNGPRNRMNQRRSVDVNNSAQLGRHLLEFGGSASRIRWTFDEVVFPRGLYGFDGAQTAPSGTTPTAAHRYADFLLGLAHSVTLSPSPLTVEENSWNSNLYVQDNWRLSGSVTINLGLRWDLFTRPTQKQGAIANYFMDNNGGRIASGKFFIDNRPSGWPTALVFNDYRDFGPRAGVAWTPTARTVLRAGFGIYYSPEISNSYTNMGLNAPFVEYVNVTASQSAPIDYGDPAAIGPLFTGQGALGAFGVDPHLRDSRAAQWNFTVERLLPADIVLNAGYVGSHGSRLTKTWDANRAINPSQPGTPIVRPNPGFAAISMSGSIGTSDYDSLQVQLLRRAGAGVTSMVAYTFAKAMGDTDGGNFGAADRTNQVQDIFDLDAARSIQSFDIRHRLTASVQYEPTFLGGGAGAARQWRDGWQLTAIITAQTGTGNGVLYGSNTSNTGVGSWPDMIADPALPRSERSMGRWFNTAAFVAPPPGRFGNSPRLSFHNPGLANVDFMIGKRVFVGNGMSALVRAEIFNVFNHTNFSEVDNSLTSPGFGTITAAADPRIVQLGLKFLF